MQVESKEMEQTPTHIVTTLDSNYIQHCGVMLCSLFKNNIQCKFKIWLIIDFEENRDLKKLRKFVKENNHLLHVIKIDGGVLKGFRTVHHITTATYYRLLIPDLIDPNLKRVIYLDVDIVVNKEISQLWQFPLEDVVIGAVPEHNFERHLELGIDSKSKYFNAGVMLINLAAWREQEITSKLLTFLQENHQRLEMLEQDALNIILQNNWAELAFEWNATTLMLSADKQYNLGNKDSRSLIIHYTGFSKPWHYLNKHPRKKDYYYYLKFTPWRNFKNQEETYWHKTKQNIKSLINSISKNKKFEIYY